MGTLQSIFLYITLFCPLNILVKSDIQKVKILNYDICILLMIFFKIRGSIFRFKDSDLTFSEFVILEFRDHDFFLLPALLSWHCSMQLYWICCLQFVLFVFLQLILFRWQNGSVIKVSPFTRCGYCRGFCSQPWVIQLGCWDKWFCNLSFDGARVSNKAPSTLDIHSQTQSLMSCT